jgi:hypothetical protein
MPIRSSDVAWRGDHLKRGVAMCDRVVLSTDQFVTSSTSSEFNEKKGGRGVRVTNHHPFFDNRIATLQLVELTVSSVISPVGLRLLKLLSPSSKVTFNWGSFQRYNTGTAWYDFFPEYWLIRSEAQFFGFLRLGSVAVWWRKMFPTFPKTYCVYCQDKRHKKE